MTREQDIEMGQGGNEEDGGDHFGTCPVCGKTDGFVNIRRSHWFFCEEHKTKWWGGENLFACWREETQEVWYRNFQKLESYTDVRPLPPLGKLPPGDGHWIEVEEGQGDGDSPFGGGKPTARLFDVGQLYATPGALKHLTAVELVESLNRHERGDWGDVSEEDGRENDLSVKEGFRILSSYTAPDGAKFWVITEADRSSTTVLLPEEY